MSQADTTFFYAPPEAFEGDRVVLPTEEAHHAFRVMRLRHGDEVQVVDGLGGWYRVVLENPGRSEAVGLIIERRLGVGESPTYLHLAVAGLKSRSRFDTLIEKVTELGVSRVSVLTTERSEHFRVDKVRADRVMRSAIKQCKRSRIPLFEAPMGWTDFVSSCESRRKLLCHEGGDNDLITHLIQSGDRDVTVAVGPEGGFSPREIEAAQAAGFQVAWLGPRRLRAETASMVACSAVLLRTDS